jgi:hypothetical protein
MIISDLLAGRQGTRTSELQRLLRAFGRQRDPTEEKRGQLGRGPSTLNAVRGVQQEVGLDPTGLAEQIFRARLQASQVAPPQGGPPGAFIVEGPVTDLSVEPLVGAKFILSFVERSAPQPVTQSITHSRGFHRVTWAPAIKHILIALMAAMCMFSIDASAQKCERRAITTAVADVYENPPRYTTGVGWQGRRITGLPRGTQLYICAEQNVDFGFSSKLFYQIAYKTDKWKYGWILADQIKLAWSELRESDVASRVALITAAFADAPPAPTPQKPEWQIGAAPPVPAAGVENGSAPSAAENALVSWSNLGALYGPLFLAMLLGMVAKGLMDCLNAATKAALREHLRTGFSAILVSPIVFLGFLNAGQFSASTQAFVVLSLMAFQNGFFWQTVLKREEQNTPAK